MAGSAVTTTVTPRTSTNCTRHSAVTAPPQAGGASSFPLIRNLPRPVRRGILSQGYDGSRGSAFCDRVLLAVRPQPQLPGGVLGGNRPQGVEVVGAGPQEAAGPGVELPRGDRGHQL